MLCIYCQIHALAVASNTYLNILSYLKSEKADSPTSCGAEITRTYVCTYRPRTTTTTWSLRGAATLSDLDNTPPRPTGRR